VSFALIFGNRYLLNSEACQLKVKLPGQPGMTDIKPYFSAIKNKVIRFTFNVVYNAAKVSYNVFYFPD